MGLVCMPCSRLCLLVAIVLLNALPSAAQNQLWVRQIQTGGRDFAYAAAPGSSGGVYVSGSTDRSLGGQSAGLDDAWLAGYDSVGNQLWVRQLGTSNYDYAYAAAPDGSGGVYVSGEAGGSLGGPYLGKGDVWLARYDSAGSQTWARQLGTSEYEVARAAAPDGSGGVYVSGHTRGSFGGLNAGDYDAWLARYDSAGNQAWVRQLGTSKSDYAWAAAPDGSGGVYVSGETRGAISSPPSGYIDAWLARYDGAGNQLWVRQLGTGSFDRAFAAAPDGAGGVYVSGETGGSLGGPSAGSIDAWLARYDSAGNQTWISQLGTSTNEYAKAAAADGSGGVYVCGSTAGKIGLPKAGFWDAWLARYGAGCGATTYCSAKPNSCGSTPTLNASGLSSASAASGFLLSASGARAGKSGLVIYTNGGARIPPAAFGGGFLCLNSPVRHSVVTTATGGTPGNCDASFDFDWNAFASGNGGGNPAGFLTTVGQQVDLQVWGRDTVQSGSFLSDALSYTICP